MLEHCHFLRWNLTKQLFIAGQIHFHFKSLIYDALKCKTIFYLTGLNKLRSLICAQLSTQEASEHERSVGENTRHGQVLFPKVLFTNSSTVDRWDILTSRLLSCNHCTICSSSFLFLYLSAYYLIFFQFGRCRYAGKIPTALPDRSFLTEGLNGGAVNFRNNV